MVPVAIGGAIVRLGNLFNSEIVGAVTDVSWGFKFVRLYPNVPIDSIPVQHPTQLYEAFCYLVIFGILCWLYYGRDLGRRRPGVMFGVGLIGIFPTRFFIEFIKLDRGGFRAGYVVEYGTVVEYSVHSAGDLYDLPGHAPLSGRSRYGAGGSTADCPAAGRQFQAT